MCASFEAIRGAFRPAVHPPDRTVIAPASTPLPPEGIADAPQRATKGAEGIGDAPSSLAKDAQGIADAPSSVTKAPEGIADARASPTNAAQGIADALTSLTKDAVRARDPDWSASVTLESTSYPSKTALDRARDSRHDAISQACSGGTGPPSTPRGEVGASR